MLMMCYILVRAYVNFRTRVQFKTYAVQFNSYGRVFNIVRAYVSNRTTVRFISYARTFRIVRAYVSYRTRVRFASYAAVLFNVRLRAFSGTPYTAQRTLFRTIVRYCFY